MEAILSYNEQDSLEHVQKQVQVTNNSCIQTTMKKYKNKAGRGKAKHLGSILLHLEFSCLAVKKLEAGHILQLLEHKSSAITQ